MSPKARVLPGLSFLFDEMLTPHERKVVDGPPVWAAGPPQREAYVSDLAYVLALKSYAQRVIVGEVMSS